MHEPRNEVSRHPETPGCPLAQTLVVTNACPIYSVNSIHSMASLLGRTFDNQCDFQCDFQCGTRVAYIYTYPFFRCCICSKKAKHSKSVSLGEEDYCEPCFRRQYLLRSAIEHFMVSFVCACHTATGICMQSTNVLFKIVYTHTLCIFVGSIYLTFCKFTITVNP